MSQIVRWQQNDAYGDSVIEQFRHIENGTLPLLARRNGILMPNRTGLLLRIGQARFITTAAHQLDRIVRDEDGYLYIVPSIYPQVKRLPLTPISVLEFKRTNEVIDIGVALLSEASVAAIEEFDHCYYSLDRLALIESLGFHNPQFTIAGFPCDVYEENEANMRQCNLWHNIAGEHRGELPDYREYNAAHHFLVRFETEPLPAGSR